MPAITVMLKPASGLCNMRCRYCFYADEQKNRSVPNYGIMSEEVLRAVLTRVLDYADGECTIAFQGGEPTCAGLPFFQRVVELEQELNHKHVVIHNAIQTNGYVIDDTWAQFFSDNHFLVGISLDGPKELHDLNRLDGKGNGTYNRVLRAISILKKHCVNLISSRLSLRPPAAAYAKHIPFFSETVLITSNTFLAWILWVKTVDSTITP